MTQNSRTIVESHDDVLEAIASEIDIPLGQYEQAVERYNSLGSWLDRDSSAIAKYAPSISPQGSFLLGTVTKPLDDRDEYDVDLTCVLKASKNDFTPKELKHAVGAEIQLYAKAHSMKKRPEEARRCWTLHYAEEAQFHMDVLPSLPDVQAHKLFLEQKGYNELALNTSLSGEAIAITDWTLPQYDQLTADWPISNPSGYAAWFRNRMSVQFASRKKTLMENHLILASVDDIPDYKVKTPLQQAIQLLKRHRDTMFSDDPEHKPISIIITTLSAHAYNEEESITAALQSILSNMDKYIEFRGDTAWIGNPVNPEENFADKWPEEPQKRTNFFSWLEKARQDFSRYFRAHSFDDLPLSLKEALGEATIERALPVSTLAAPPIISEREDGASTQGRAEAAIEKVRQTGTESKPWVNGD